MQVWRSGRGGAHVLKLGGLSSRQLSALNAKEQPKLLTKMQRVKSSLGLPKPGFSGKMVPQEVNERPKLVILGSGWASYYTIAELGPEALKQYDIKVVSKDNYFTYTPMLPSLSVGTLESESIVQPV